jgi:hypothetical protein
VIPVILRDSFREEGRLVSAGVQIEYRIPGQRPGAERTRDLHRAFEDFDPLGGGIEVNAEQRFAARRKRRIGCEHLVHVPCFGGCTECCVAHVHGEAVDFASIGSQGKLGEFKHGKLAEPHGRAVFEFNFGKAAFRRRKLEAFLDGSVHWGFGPIRKVRPLHRDMALDKTEANNARVRISLPRCCGDPQKNRRTKPHQNSRCRLFDGCHGPPPQTPRKD